MQKVQSNQIHHAPEERLYKVIVVGEAQTGKTCLIRKYVHNIFLPNTKVTIGVDFALKVLNWDRSTTVTLQLWDIAGQERYGQLTRVYYQGAVGAFVVYDVTRGDTFEAAAKWKQDIDNKVFLPDGNRIPCILLANKSDMDADPKRTSEELEEFCQKNGFVTWFETSSKTSHNIDRAFHKLVEEVLAADGEVEAVDRGANAVALGGRRREGQGGQKPSKRSGCCK